MFGNALQTGCSVFHKTTPATFFVFDPMVWVEMVDFPSGQQITLSLDNTPPRVRMAVATTKVQGILGERSGAVFPLYQEKVTVCNVIKSNYQR